MAEELIGNILVAQSGGPTTVINSSLAGVITEALNHDCIEEIYGGLNGIQGILNEEIIDLAVESQQAIRGLRHTAGCALGTCRYKMTQQKDFDRIIEVFQAHNIRYFFYIGGNDSQDTVHKIAECAQSKGYDLRVIGIPKTVDNDLPITDHCPGYGSAIKYIATTIREMAQDHASMGMHDLVSIVEIMGRNTGWLTAGASLAKRRNHPEDAPHLIYLPEVPFQADKFLEDVQTVLKKERFCMIAASEGLVDDNGNYIANASASTDAFGHAQLGGVGEYLRSLVEQHLGIKARAAKLGIAQRAAVHMASKTDNDEAFYCGQAAVQAAVEGESGKMVTLVRSEADPYTCETSLTPLEDVANQVKAIPESWIDENGTSMKFPFIKYARPLIEGEIEMPFEDGLPKQVVLQKERIEKKVEAYAMA